MSADSPYPIGTPGQPWGDAEKAEWLARQSVQRSYAEEVVAKLRALDGAFELKQYGSLAIDPGRYPLFAALNRPWNPDRPVVLITGGVHGYETSGAQGALRFLASRAVDYLSACDLVVAPCVSPWGYETINRWNPLAVDPNRSFLPGSASEEARALMDFVAPFANRVQVHIDLHETTDTDNTEFRPALAARDGVVHDNWDIPDGFYLVGDADCPAPAFQRAVIAAVEAVTPIAPADAAGRLIGTPLEQHGVINYAARSLGLCMGLTDARWRTTTEVYPDSERVDGENCILAQVAAVTGALDYALAQLQAQGRG
jgi:Succinylglutamate desuccinylase / Aspartoacylase family